MAYMSQDKKKALAPAILAVCKKHGVKASLAVSNNSTLVLNIKSGPIDFVSNFNEMVKQSHEESYGVGSYKPRSNVQVNPYHYEKDFSGDALKFLSEVIPLMYIGNWDKSDIQSDYHNVGWWVDVNIGRWDQPYQLIK